VRRSDDANGCHAGGGRDCPSCAPRASHRDTHSLEKCGQVNAKYPHGVGKVGAHDKTSGVPVTTFKRSTRLYRIAMSYNRGLDRDKDGIACEKL
jgi:hypothetical protein